MAIWNELWRTKSTQHFAKFVGEPHEVVAGEAYISVELNAMHIADVRKGLTTFYPAVHSNIGVPHLSGEVRQFQKMSAPSNFGKLDARHLDRVIVIKREQAVEQRSRHLGVTSHAFSPTRKSDRLFKY
jgi:hypothetical protein